VRCRYCGQLNQTRLDIAGAARCGRCRLLLSDLPHQKFAELDKDSYIHPADAKALAALRAIPGLEVVRPGDANEVVACWAHILRKADAPAGLCLSRQNLPVFPRGTDENGETWAAAEHAARGGYVLVDADRTAGGLPDVVLIGTGSELQVAVAARTLLAEEGVRARVVSMPCREWFDAQDEAYRDAVIPPIVKARVSVEAGVAQGWREVVGDHGQIVSVDTYGASAAYQRIFEEYGITAEAVARAARDSIASVNGG
jgi:transketolase